MFGISPFQLAVVLLIVVLVFGTKKLRGMGGDLGGAIKSFKDAMNNGKDEKPQQSLTSDSAKPEATEQDAQFKESQKDKDKV